MAEENKIIIDVQLDSRAANKQAQELTKQLALQRRELAKYRDVLKEGAGNTQEQAEAFEEAGRKVNELTKKIKENNTSLRLAQREAKATANSQEALRASVAKLTRERANLNTSTEQGAARFAELTATIRQQTDALKEMEGAVGDNRRNVGNYKNSIIEALQSNQMFTASLGEAGVAFEGLAGGTNLFGASLAALPILAIIKLLQLFFTETARGRRIMQEFADKASGALGKVTQDLAKLGEAMYDFGRGSRSPAEAFKDGMSGALDQVTNRLEAVRMNMVSLFELDFDKYVDSLVQFTTGFESEKVRSYADELARVAELSARIAKANRRGGARIRQLREEAAEQQRIAEENRKIRDDERLSFAEREQANARALEAEKQRRDALLAIREEERMQIERAVRLRAQQGDRVIRYTEEEKDRLSELRVEIAEVYEDFASRTTETQTEAFAIQRERLQAQINREAAIVEEGVLRRTLSRKEEYQQRLQILALQEQAELVGLKEGGEQALLIEQQFINERLKLRQEFAEDIMATREAEAVEVARIEMGITDTIIEEGRKRLDAEKVATDESKKLMLEKYQMQLTLLGQAKAITGAIIATTKEGTQAQRAALVAEQGIGVAEVIVNAQREISKNGAQLGTIGVLATLAPIAARVAGAIATIQSVGFASGGYTGDGGTHEPAGTVHRGEFVVPKRRVQALGGASKVARLTGTPVRGYASGGLVGAEMASSARSASTLSGLSSDIRQLQVQVAVTDIRRAEGRYDAVQAKVNA